MSDTDACPACGGPLSAWRILPASDPALGERSFALERCGRCGTAVTLGPAPPDLYETGAYRPGVPRLHDPLGPALALFDRQRLALLRPQVPPPARLLDVGAGRGRFVAAAGSAGYEATGIEVSERGVAAAAALGVPVTRAAIQDARLAAGSADAVTLWHVLEHLDDPGGALDRVSEWLVPGGAVLVGVPNLASLQARLGGAAWYHLDVPRHRVHFTPAGLTALLRSRGFAVLATHHVLAEHNPFGMWQSLLSRFTRQSSYLYHLLKRNAPVRSTDLVLTLAALPLLPAAALLELGAAAAGRGGTIAVLARREG